MTDHSKTGSRNSQRSRGRASYLLAAGLLAASMTGPARAFDALIPGKLLVAKSGGKLVKVLAKAPKVGPLFQLPTSDPSAVTTTLEIVDTAGDAGHDVYGLNAGEWKGLGTPAGSKGWKYSGAGTAADPCKVVLVKPNAIKAVCKDAASGGGGITIIPPFTGNAGVILSVGSDRYCAEWGGTEVANDAKLIKRKDAPAPAACATGSAPTDTPTAVATDTSTATPSDTPIATDSPTSTPTPIATDTSTPTDTPAANATPTPTETTAIAPSSTPTGTPTPTATPISSNRTFAAGSLIIPMDTTYQDSGMLKAFGLVHKLLRSGIPVYWVIKPGKAFQTADFTASAVDTQTSAVITSHGYRGGPWVIDSSDAAAALPIISAWQASNVTAVHQATGSFTGDGTRQLTAAPSIAVFADGNQNIAIGYLNAAGIPDSQHASWPSSSPDLLTPLEVAGPTTTNHADGALFDASGQPTYCNLASAHWNVTNAQANPEVVAEVRQFLTHPVHLFAECQSVDAFENIAPYGHFLTPNGFTIKAQPSTLDYYHADSPFMQIDGPFGTVGGSEPAYALPAGDSYKASGVTMLTSHGSAEGAHDLWLSGYLDGTCPPDVASCGGVGRISYLGGHQYTTVLPISMNPKTQGVRLFLQSLFAGCM